MIKLKDILLEFQGKRLAVFDFDDTLAKSEAYIYVTKSDGEELKLDPAEYAVYEEEPGAKSEGGEGADIGGAEDIDAGTEEVETETETDVEV